MQKIIKDINGHVIAKYDKKSQVLEVKNRNQLYRTKLVSGFPFTIETGESISVLSNKGGECIVMSRGK